MTTLKDAGQARSMKVAAEKRSAIAAHFAGNPQLQKPAEVAQALGWKLTRTLPALKDAYERGLISRSGASKRIAYAAATEGAPSEGRLPKPVVSVKTPKAKTPVTTAVPASKDVELVVAGVLVIIGKNPLTGRLRIQIEDMAP